MLSKNKQKFILSLTRKKNRDQQGLFVAEGHKLVSDLLSSKAHVHTLVATSQWLASHPQPTARNFEIIEADQAAIKKISTLKSPPDVVGIFLQDKNPLTITDLRNSLSLFLDEVQDPGNLGTIVRLADWFGIQHIICTPTCADIYNPKTIQSTMGAIARVDVHYRDASVFLSEYKKLELPVYGTFLDGDNIYSETLSNTGLIVMGNEGKGISKAVESAVSHRLFIPAYPADLPTSESLNVSVATAITCAEFRRQATASPSSSR
ncbi:MULTISPECIES: TrmH family RNA methyltransferase [unclassified Carboxylicivirga]|uniref:TrmH family RNA methyltransferase n=1 Tax=Carboxylicivirga TaxID=1628153 RepID=UPI003D32FB71